MGMILRSPYPTSTAAWAPTDQSGLVMWALPIPANCFTDTGLTTNCGDGDQCVRMRSQDSHQWIWNPQTSTGGSGWPLLVNVGGVWRWQHQQNYFSTDLNTANVGDAITTGAATIGVRWQFTDTSPNNEFIATRPNDSYARFVGDENSYPGQLRTSRIEAQPGFTVNTWYTTVIRSDATTWTRRDNGTQTISTSADFNPGNGWYIGAGPGATPKGLTGYIAGAVAYDSVLTGTALSNLETYLGGL